MAFHRDLRPCVSRKFEIGKTTISCSTNYETDPQLIAEGPLCRQILAQCICRSHCSVAASVAFRTVRFCMHLRWPHDPNCPEGEKMECIARTLPEMIRLVRGQFPKRCDKRFVFSASIRPGAIPSEMGRLAALRKLDLSSNKLTGERRTQMIPFVSSERS